MLTTNENHDSTVSHAEDSTVSHAENHGYCYSKWRTNLTREMLWGGRWEGGSCLGTHVRIKDFKIKKIKN